MEGRGGRRENKSCWSHLLKKGHVSRTSPAPAPALAQPEGDAPAWGWRHPRPCPRPDGASRTAAPLEGTVGSGRGAALAAGRVQPGDTQRWSLPDGHSDRKLTAPGAAGGWGCVCALPGGLSRARVTEPVGTRTFRPGSPAPLCSPRLHPHWGGGLREVSPFRLPPPAARRPFGGVAVSFLKTPSWGT